MDPRRRFAEPVLHRSAGGLGHQALTQRETDGSRLAGDVARRRLERAQPITQIGCGEEASIGPSAVGPPVNAASMAPRYHAKYVHSARATIRRNMAGS